MHRIELSDQVFTEASKLASARGFSSVAEFISDVVSEEATIEAEDNDILFTPEWMAAIARGMEDAKAGRVYSSAEVESHILQWRKEWRRTRES